MEMTLQVASWRTRLVAGPVVNNREDYCTMGNKSKHLNVFRDWICARINCAVFDRNASIIVDVATDRADQLQDKVVALESENAKLKACLRAEVGQ